MKCGVSRGTVQRAAKKLVRRAGMFHVEQERSDAAFERELQKELR